LKFTTKGGVTIRVAYCEANVCKISVIDTGVGIKPNDIKMLFKKFSKVAETQRMNQQGVGLGLVISNMLAKRLGNNSITVESRYGSGTTFSFELESKVHLAQSKELEGGLSSDEEDLGCNVMDNINGMKEKNKRADIQKMKLFERRLSVFLHRHSGSKNNSFIKPSLRKASILNYSLQMAQFHSRDDPKEGECSSPYLRESPPIINLLTPTPKVGFNKNNLDLNPNIPRLSLSSSAEDRTNSFGLRSPMKSRTVFEEEGFAKHMDEKAKLVHKLSHKLNLLSADDPYILVVDDNAFNIIALTKILEGLNMRTDSATSGDLAIQKILERQNKRDKQTYKVIFMDCSMPVKDGYIVTREIRDLQEKGVIPKIQIVAVTASNYPNDIKRCFDSGMDDYLIKPVSLDLMKNILAKHIANDDT